MAAAPSQARLAMWVRSGPEWFLSPGCHYRRPGGPQPPAPRKTSWPRWPAPAVGAARRAGGGVVAGHQGGEGIGRPGYDVHAHASVLQPSALGVLVEVAPRVGRP